MRWPSNRITAAQGDQAARLLLSGLLRIALAKSPDFALSSKSALMSRSIVTEGSPASILATRDWLDCSRFARSVCDSPYCVRRSRSIRLKANFISISAASASESPKKSLTEPMTHPDRSSLVRLLFLIVAPLRLASHTAEAGSGSDQ